MILHTLTKSRSKYRIDFIVDPHKDNTDGWFILVRWIEKKTEKITDESMIIRKDVNTWISNLKSTGWQLCIKE
jgi:hypothetical protein